jgi:hypothetical protein
MHIVLKKANPPQQMLGGFAISRFVGGNVELDT